MKTKIIALIIIALVLGAYAIYLNIPIFKSKNQEKKLYQGPVPEGYDEDYFRLTGITKSLGENN